jgi:hypothetical protein
MNIMRLASLTVASDLLRINPYLVIMDSLFVRSPLVMQVLANASGFTR